MLLRCFTPEAKRTLWFFFGSMQRWGCLGLLSVTGGGDNKSMNCYCFCSESFFLASLILWQEEVAPDRVSICVLMHESARSSPGALHIQNGKISLEGKNPLS